jgi:RNA polymerase sigma-70 factor (ECF subfamily)
MENITYPDIAKKLGVSVRTVEVRISRALAMLRDALRDYLILVVLLLLNRL